MEKHPVRDDSLAALDASGASLDLLCVGGAAADLVLRLPRLPASDEKLVVDFAGWEPGGLVANAACAAARLGLRTAWSGLLGEDAAAELLRRDFAGFGVDFSLAETRPGHATNFTVILLEPSGERTILVANTLPTPGLDKLDDAVFERTRLVYALPYELEWFQALAERVHAAGGKLAVDIESSSPLQGQALGEALRRCDLVFCSRDGLQLAAGTQDVERGAQALLSLGAELVVVTLGREGAWAAGPGGSAQVSAHQVLVSDTTGAGDCFHAAFLLGYLAQWPLERSLSFANAAAAFSVQKVGARAGYPTRPEVETFLAARGVTGG